MNLVDGLASVTYSLGTNCEGGNSTIVITNKSEDEIQFVGVAADQDRTSLFLEKIIVRLYVFHFG